jgi:hypothetical protein
MCVDVRFVVGAARGSLVGGTWRALRTGLGEQAEFALGEDAAADQAFQLGSGCHRCPSARSAGRGLGRGPGPASVGRCRRRWRGSADGRGVRTCPTGSAATMADIRSAARPTRSTSTPAGRTSPVHSSTPVRSRPRAQAALAASLSPRAAASGSPNPLPPMMLLSDQRCSRERVAHSILALTYDTGAGSAADVGRRRIAMDAKQTYEPGLCWGRARYIAIIPLNPK